jgi:hypothetical protein
MRYIISEVYPSGSSVVVNGDVWSDGTCLGKRQVSLSAIQVMQIVTDEELNENQKKAAIRDLVVAQVQSWRLTEALDASVAVRDLAPEFPITLTFDPAPLPEPPEGNGDGDMIQAVKTEDRTEDVGASEPERSLFTKIRELFK